MHKLLGVHVLTRNEEQLLPQCLDSVKQIADEIIVIDTGSTDQTLDISRSYDATILSANWEDDFSLARNVGLVHANTEWILYLDADEMLVTGMENLLELLDNQEAEAFWVEIISPVGAQREERICYQTVRLFRNRDFYRFQGRIHEQIIPSILQRYPIEKIKQSYMQIHHFGYLPWIMKQKEKATRNLRLLERTLTESPDDPFHTYNLGVTCCQLGQLDKAALHLRKAREITPPQASFRPSLIRDSAKILISLEEWEEASRLLTAEANRYPDYPDLFYLLGQVLEHQGLLLEAFQAYQKATKRLNQPVKYITEDGMSTYRSFHAMAQIASELESPEEANQYYQKSLQSFAGYRPALLGWADFLHRFGNSDEVILEKLCMFLPVTSSAESLLLATAMAQIGAYGEVLTLLKNFPSATFESERLRCESLMQTGQFPEAYEQLGRLLSQSDIQLRERLILDRALCRWSEDRTLPFSFYQGLPPEYQRAYEQLDRWLAENIMPASPVEDPFFPELLQHLIERAVQLRLIRLAGKLSQLTPDLPLFLAARLYRQGYVLLSADALLQLMGENRLDDEGIYILAEILHDKGHFAQAASLFEQVPSNSPLHERASTGAALCYLQLAQEALRQGLQRFPDHPPFQTDLQRIASSIRLLNGTRWHTTWCGAERRNFDAAVNDLTLYDRQG